MINHNEAGRVLSEMVQISRTFRIAGQRSREQSFTGTKFGFLQLLRDGDARLGELAHRLFVSAPVASRAVDSLETDGMVERRTDPHDGRAFLISMTDRGRAKLTEGESETVRRFADALTDWSPEDAEHAIEILKRLNGHLSEVTQTPGSAETASTPHATTTTDNGSEFNG